MTSTEPQVTAFPASIAAGVIAMALSEGLGWNVYPPVAFVVCFLVTMVVVLHGMSRDLVHVNDTSAISDQHRVHVGLGK